MPKKCKRGLGFFNIHFVAKYRKIEGGLIGDTKKSHKAEKIEKEALQSRPVMNVILKKEKMKPFAVT